MQLASAWMLLVCVLCKLCHTDHEVWVSAVRGSGTWGEAVGPTQHMCDKRNANETQLQQVVDKHTAITFRIDVRLVCMLPQYDACRHLSVIIYIVFSLWSVECNTLVVHMFLEPNFLIDRPPSGYICQKYNSINKP